LFLIGGMRCGSTTLHLLLGQHPEIFMSPVKEPMFYVAEAMRRAIPVGDHAQAEHRRELEDFVGRGKYRERELYESLFRGVADEPFVGESSHYLYHPKVSRTIFEDCREARIVVSLREPIQRLYSEYLFLVRENKAERSFRDFVLGSVEVASDGTVREVRGSRLNKSLYSERLRHWIEVFGADNVKTVLFRDFVRDPSRLCQEIYQWLGVDSSFRPQIIHTERSGQVRSRRLFEAVRNNRWIRKTLRRFTSIETRAAIRDTWYRALQGKDHSIDPEIKDLLNRFYADDLRSLQNSFGIVVSE
jgi:hypothetical protein